MRLRAGESIFIPRETAHAWAAVGGKPSKIINVYQPAGRMEEFFRAVGSCKDLPSREDVSRGSYTEKQVAAVKRLFADHGIDLLGPPRSLE